MASGVASIVVTVDGKEYNLTKSASDSNVWTTTAAAPSKSSGVHNGGNGVSIGGTGGYYLCTVKVTDLAGNVTTVTGNATGTTLQKALAMAVEEKTGPTVKTSSPSSGAFVTQSKPTFTWVVTDSGSGVKSSTISVDGATAVAGTTSDTTYNTRTYTYIPTSALADGTHTVVLSGTDYDGNTTTNASFSFKVDTVPPSLAVTSMGKAFQTTGYTGEAYLTNQTTVTLTGTCSDANGVALKINDTALNKAYDVNISNGSWSYGVPCTNGTNHTLQIIATDGYGRTTTINRSIYCDTVAPAISKIELTNPAFVGARWEIKVTVTDPES